MINSMTGFASGELSTEQGELSWEIRTVNHRYLEAQFEEVDPVLRGASASFEPVDWAELDWRGQERQGFREESRAFGIGEQGYTVPVRGPSGQYAIFTINKSCGRDSWQKLLKEHRTDFMLLAHFTHQRVLKLAGCKI